MSAHSAFIEPEVSIGATISTLPPRVSSQTIWTKSSASTATSGWPLWPMMGVSRVSPTATTPSRDCRSGSIME